MTTFEQLLQLPHISRINLDKETERLFYKEVIKSSGLENCYANSWAYIWQIANENSFKYHDGSVLLSLTPGWGNSFPDELTINSRQTPDAAETAIDFAAKAAALFNRRIFIRKIYDTETKNYLAEEKGLKRVPKYQESKDVCSLPDDNFPERVIEIQDQIEGRGKRYEYFRRKHNVFLRVADISLFEIREDYPSEDYFSLLDHWSRDIAARLCKRYPSMKYEDIVSWTRSPYPSLHAFFRKYREEEDLFTFMAYYDEKPAGLLCSVRISAGCAALYGNYSINNIDGFAFHHALMVSRYLQKKGFTHINQGGSEIAGLDFYKKKCGGFQKIFPESFVIEP